MKFLISNYSNYSRQIPNPKSQLGQLEIRSIRLIFLLICLLVYWLTIASPTLATYEEGQISPQSPFVSNQIIVKYKENQTPAVVQSQVEERSVRAQSFFGVLQNAAENVNYRLSGQSTPEEKLKRIENANDQAGVVEEEELFTSDVLGADTSDSQTPSSLSGFYLYTTDGSTSIPGVIQMYQTLSEIEFAEPNYMMKILETPNDSYYSEMWNLGKIQMEAAWDQTKGDNSVKVAVVDTGINYNHEDFSGRNIINERDFSTCAACDDNGNCIETKTRDNDSMDDNGHGTHVAGTIGAVTNNTKGIAGINWNVSLMAVKTLGRTGCGGTADIVEAIKHAADKGAKVINLSLGGEPACSSSGSWQSAINYVRGKGVTVVVAAGNENQNASNFTPASCSGVIAVGATNSNDQRASFSNWGTVVDLAAPGTSILSTLPVGATVGPTCRDADGNGYDTCNGTSMASPHVAGVAALMLAKKSSLTADNIEQFLKDNGDEISSPGKPIGKRLNANKVLLAVSGGTTPTATPTPTGPINTPTPSVTPGGPTLTPTRTPTPTVTPGGPTRTPTPTITPGGPTSTPTPTVTPGGPTVTPTRIPSPTSGPSSTPRPTPVHPCPEQAKNGNYDCKNGVIKDDFDAWFADYKEGKTTLSYYEYWRRAFYGGGGTLSPTPTPKPTVKPTSTPTPAVLSPTPTSPTPTIPNTDSKYGVMNGYYGDFDVNDRLLIRERFEYLKSLGVNILEEGFIESTTKEDWEMYLDEAKNAGIEVIAAWGKGRYKEYNNNPKWLGNENKFDISFDQEFISTVGNHPALYGFIGLHEPAEVFTGNQIKIYYNQIKQINPNLKILTFLSGEAYKSAIGTLPPEKRFTDDWCDICHQAALAYKKGNNNECVFDEEKVRNIVEIGSDYIKQQDHNAEILWNGQTFGENKQCMPTPDIMKKEGGIVFDSGKIDIFVWQRYDKNVGNESQETLIDPEFEAQRQAVKEIGERI